MKKAIALILFVVSASCSLPSHSFQYPRQTGVDFRSGKWLLYTLDVPGDVRKRLEEKIMDDLSKPLGSRLAYYPNSNGLLVPQRIGMQLDKKTISEIKDGTGYDYLVTFRSATLTNDLRAVSFKQNASFPPEQSNSAYAEMEIYDLDRKTLIYSQKVVSSVRRSKDRQKINFAKTSNELMLHAYKKLLRDLKAKSIE